MPLVVQRWFDRPRWALFYRPAFERFDLQLRRGTGASSVCGPSNLKLETFIEGAA